ncbi:MAG: 1,4-alpha-glucan branching protein GlgB [Clostridiales bacterium]|nr:1,4-alpha-glucan branching protein GlgB [Clostridiales bacterium]
MDTMEKDRFIKSFSAGSAIRAGEFLGAFPDDSGTVFRVWAPNAVEVFVVGDWNDWQLYKNPMSYISGGIWQCHVPEAKILQHYKFAISTRDGQVLWKADPYGIYAQLRPESASRLYDLSGYDWGDKAWMSRRKRYKMYNRPLNIYELHFASWRHDENGLPFTYRTMADVLIPYVLSMGFTHIEFMPLSEYPYDGSWGYQCTGYFAATSRFGEPKDLMYLIDRCHRAGIGVIMDWVPAHFPKDPHGLVEFDGSRLYEENDPLMAEHPSWGTRIFDYSKGEVRSFLISSALHWLEKFHVDGLRVDAVASMLYLDYDRDSGQWKPNEHGGRENLGAVSFLKQLNEACFSYDDSILMIAEESTAWPLVTAPSYSGGLGFNLKWNMGWMNDTLHYIKTDPLFRKDCHNDLTFSIMYAFSENYVLPISHDEVVHMKGSVMTKATGTREQKLSSLRLLWAYMLAHPGKKLLFMGAELSQESEWDYEGQLPWQLLEEEQGLSTNRFFSEANSFYKDSRPLWEKDFDPSGFMWLCPDERDRNLLAFIRRDKHGKELYFICNFSGVEALGFRLPVTALGLYGVSFSTDEERFGGTGSLVEGSFFKADKTPHLGQNHSIILDLPPLSAVFLRRTRSKSPQVKK